MPKITSWSQFTTIFCGLKNRAVTFWQNHPRVGGGLAIFIFGLVLSVGFYHWNLQPMAYGAKQKQIVEIDYGSSLRQIGTLLQKRGLIRNQAVFELYIRLHQREKKIKAGSYELNPGMNVPHIAAEIERGTSLREKVTIPEGFTNREILNLLVAKGLVDKTRFLDKLNDRLFIQGIIGEEYDSHWPEGYLFPDTYFFDKKADEAEIITLMLRRFKEVFAKNFTTVSGSKIKETLILASIIEKEARKAEERPIIAGVFVNRLQRDFPLQSCATIEYALGVHKERLTFKDLEVESPYNTYRHQGLPPTPISNPGLASIRAAFNPAKVNFLYFVAKPDGTHIFSNTFDQHLKAQRRIEQERKKG